MVRCGLSERLAGQVRPGGPRCGEESVQSGSGVCAVVPTSLPPHDHQSQESSGVRTLHSAHADSREKTTGQRESYISTANVGGHTRCPRSRPGHPIRRSRGTMRHLRSLGAPHCGPLRRSMFGLLSPRRRVPVLTSTAPMVRRIGPIDVLGPRALMGGLSALDSRNSWWRRMSARRAFASAPSRSGCTITP